MDTSFSYVLEYRTNTSRLLFGRFQKVPSRKEVGARTPDPLKNPP
jgi:hypothetical protein